MQRVQSKKTSQSQPPRSVDDLPHDGCVVPILVYNRLDSQSMCCLLWEANAGTNETYLCGGGGKETLVAAARKERHGNGSRGSERATRPNYDGGRTLLACGSEWYGSPCERGNQRTSPRQGNLASRLRVAKLWVTRKTVRARKRL